jgi:hypothetical protein
MSTPKQQSEADSSSGLRALLEQIAESRTKNASTKFWHWPTAHAQTISAEAFERWLVDEG